MDKITDFPKSVLMGDGRLRACNEEFFKHVQRVQFFAHDFGAEKPQGQRTIP